jgi:hypothetical protein
MLDSNMKIIFRLLRAKPRPTPLAATSRAKQDHAEYFPFVTGPSLFASIVFVLFCRGLPTDFCFCFLFFRFVFLLFYSVAACAHAPAAQPRMGLAGPSKAFTYAVCARHIVPHKRCNAKNVRRRCPPRQAATDAAT